MGWLDNSTNNIILDAVLTDYGRQVLSQSTRSSGGFNISKYSFGDDEVDYRIVKKYGRTVGKEKIEKNTPIFEAFTNQNIALKNKLFSSYVPLLYVPKFEVTTGQNIILVTSGVNSANVVVTQSPQGSNVLDPAVRESQFVVVVPSLFLILTNTINDLEVPGSLLGNTKNYTLGTDSGVVVSANQVDVKFKLKTRTLTNSIFDVYANNAGVINTSVRVTGVQTGTSVDIPIQIKQTP